jgi:hypothetical protein
VKTLRQEKEILRKAGVGSTGRCNMVGFSVLFGSEVEVWLDWVVRGCPKRARSEVPLVFRVPHNSWAYLPRNTLVLGKQRGQHGGDLFILRRVSTLETLH